MTDSVDRHRLAMSTLPRFKVEFLPRSNLKVPRWTLEEIQVLRDHYQNGGTRRVARLLPKRHGLTINRMAAKLGLRKGPYVPPKRDIVDNSIPQ